MVQEIHSAISKIVKILILTVIQSPSIPFYHYTANADCPITHREVTTSDDRARIIFSQDKREDLSVHVRPGKKKYPICALCTKHNVHASGNHVARTVAFFIPEPLINIQHSSSTFQWPTHKYPLW